MPTRLELIAEAKQKGLKGYSNKSKAELCKMLGKECDEPKRKTKTKKTSPKGKKSPQMKKKPSTKEEKMTVVELKALAKERGLKNYSKLKKAELIKLLFPSPKKPSPKKSPKKLSPKKSPERISKEFELKKGKSPLPKGETPKAKIEEIPIFHSPQPKVPIPKPKREGDCIARSHLKPKPHQLRSIEHMRNNRGLIDAHSTGTGKTLIAVILAMCFHEKYPDRDIYFTTPVSLQGNIKKEIINYGEDPENPKFHFFTLDGFKKEFAGKAYLCTGSLLIIDEAHNLKKSIVTKGKNKNKYTKSRVAVECAIKAEKVLLLTATPILNYPHEIINLMAMVRGEIPITEKEFNRILSDPLLTSNYFKNYISMYYPIKDRNYPRMEKEYVNLMMSEEYYRDYHAVELSQEHKFKIADPYIFYTGVRMAANSLGIRAPKIDWTMNLLKQGKRTVIYSAFKAYGIRKIQQEVKKLGKKYVEVTGEMAKGKRDEAVRKYNRGDVDIFFITKAGGEGLDLKATRYLVKFESSWNVAQEEQVEGRVRRYGSHTHLPEDEQIVTVFDLIHTKPPLTRRDLNDNKYESADVILKELSEKKRLVNDEFFNRISEYTIEQFQETNYKMVREMNELKQIPFGNHGSAFNLYNDLMIHAYKTIPFYMFMINTNLVNRYKHIRNEFFNIYNFDRLNPKNKELYIYTNSPNFKPFYSMGIYSLDTTFVTERQIYYAVKDIVDLFNHFKLGNFDYNGIIFKDDYYFIQWKDLDREEKEEKVKPRRRK